MKGLPYQWGNQTQDVYQELTSKGGFFVSRRYAGQFPAWAMADFFGLHLWQWIGLSLYLFGSAILTLLAHIYGRKALHILDKRQQWELEHNVGGLILPVALICFPKIGLKCMVHGLHIFNTDIYLPIAFVLFTVTLSRRNLVNSGNP